MNKFLYLVSFLMPIWSMAIATPRDPIGEKAYYELDKTSSRTSSMIKGGKFEAKVTGESDSNEPSFDVDLKYELKVDLLGTYKGTETIEAPAEYFSEEFLTNIRDVGTYEAPKFKVKHRGYKDASNRDGRRYPNCDLLLIYDIDTKAFNFIRQAFKRMAVRALEAKGIHAPDGDIEDLQILAHVKYGIPVLGAVKLDVKGKYSGMSLKAGADYKADHN